MTRRPSFPQTLIEAVKYFADLDRSMAGARRAPARALDDAEQEASGVNRVLERSLWSVLQSGSSLRGHCGTRRCRVTILRRAKRPVQHVYWRTSYAIYQENLMKFVDTNCKPVMGTIGNGKSQSIPIDGPVLSAGQLRATGKVAYCPIDLSAPRIGTSCSDAAIFF